METTHPLKVALINTRGMRKSDKKHFAFYVQVGLQIRNTIGDMKNFFFTKSSSGKWQVDLDVEDKVVIRRSRKDPTPILIIQPA